MATKKVVSSKGKSSARNSTRGKSAARAEKPVIVEEEIVEIVENPSAEISEDFDDSRAEKKSIGEKFKSLRPSALIAEIFGTFILTGAVLNWATQNTIGAAGVALVLAALVMIFGVVSGAHLNPAITIAQWINRKIDGVKALTYILAQVVGAVLMMFVALGTFTATNSNYEKEIQAKLVVAAQVTDEQIEAGGGLEKFLSTNYQGMTVKDAAAQLGITTPTPTKPWDTHKDLTKGTQWQTFLLEMLGALIFGLGVGYAVYAKKKNAVETGLAVGLSLFAGLVIGGATVILNPAVAGAIGGFEAAVPFGAGAMTFWWSVFIYIFGTTIGMTAGFTIYRFILKDILAKR